jgi:hypothetical protein
MGYGKKELIPPKLLYKYRPFADPHDSVQRMLARNMWWFGSRRGFDDSEDFVFPGIRMIASSQRIICSARRTTCRKFWIRLACFV